MDYLLPGERFDELQRNGYRIIQNPAKFCFGMDAVLLSGFATGKNAVKGYWISERYRHYPDSDGSEDGG